MKPFIFAIIGLASTVAFTCPAGAQFGGGGYNGVQFVEAVRKSDGDKATQLLESNAPGLVNARGEDGDTAVIIAIARRALDPSSAPCSADDVPMRAQFVWRDGGGVVFEVIHVADRVEFASAQLLVPPGGGAFAPSYPPPTSGT